MVVSCLYTERLEQLSFSQCYNRNCYLIQRYFLGGTVVCSYGSCSSLLRVYLHAWFSCSASCWDGSRFPSDCSLWLPDFMVCYSASFCVICKLYHQCFFLFFFFFLDIYFLSRLFLSGWDFISYVGISTYLCPFRKLRTVVSQTAIIQSVPLYRPIFLTGV